MSQDLSSTLRDAVGAQAESGCCPYIVNLFNDSGTILLWIQNIPNCGFVSTGNLAYELSLAVCQGSGGSLQVNVPDQGDFMVSPPSTGSGTVQFSVSQVIAAGNGNGQLPGGFTAKKI